MSGCRTCEDLDVLPRFDLNDLPGEWWLVHDTSEADDLAQELAREVPEGHILNRRSVNAVAVRRHLKETLFWLPETSQWALVHLSWRAETDTRWPATVVADDWQALVAELV